MALPLAPRFKRNPLVDSVTFWIQELVRWADIAVTDVNNRQAVAWGLITTGASPSIQATSGNWSHVYDGDELKITLDHEIDSLVVPVITRAAIAPNFFSTRLQTKDSFQIAVHNSGGAKENLSVDVREIAFAVFGREVR